MSIIFKHRYTYLFTVLAAVFMLCSFISFARSENAQNLPAHSSTTSSNGGASDFIATTTTTEGVKTEPPVTVVPKNITVCIDAGHGWSDNGASSSLTDSEGNPLYYEKDINLAISKYLRDSLEALGYTVVMIRESDNETSPAGIASDNICNITRRVSWINTRPDISLMVSIHCDSFSSENVNGTRIYYNKIVHADTDALGNLMMQSLVSGGAADKAPLLYDDSNKLWSLKRTVMPSILVECGFITGNSDIHKLTDSNYQKLFAKCLANAIDDYFENLKAAQ